MSSLPSVYWPGASGYASVYRPLVAASPAEPQPVVLDYPGLGDAPRQEGIDSLDDLYRYAVESLPERCNLIALSMGSVLALRAALEFPRRIHRMVLIAAAGGVDVLGLGASDWRAGWVARRPTAPRWFVDDRTDLSERLAEIEIPTLLVFGDCDPIAPPTVAHHLRARLRQPTLEIIAGATHDIVEEQGQHVSGLIARHLQPVL